MRKLSGFVLFILFSLSIYGCSNTNTEQAEAGSDAFGHTPPTQITSSLNNEVLKELPFSDTQDFENANKGLIAQEPALIIKNQAQEIIWDQTSYEFMNKAAPESVNPSLWRQGKLNNIHGLFKVTDGIYQVRGYDLANLTIIESENGWIVVDTLTSKETAAHAMAFARKHLGDRPVVAVIYTHSHIDHFGGVLGVISAAEAKKNNIKVIAPKGFMEAATSENLTAGIAMGRRAGYMYGKGLARSDRGHVGSGLGKSPAFGTYGILAPTDIIDHTLQEKVIDGVRFVFQYAPDSEAPGEMTFYLPEKKAFCGAEIVSRTCHNLYTLRGAAIRDGKKWSHYIGEAMDLFSDTQVYFGTHHWPLWGNEQILSFMEKQRDLYKFTHDQTVRMFNAGLTPLEIAETIKLPDSLSKSFFNRGYYGTLRHNSRAVYQKYLGWYDANPAGLNPLPPVEAGKRYVKLMGGKDAVIESAKKAFDDGQYRWVAQLLNHLVFANPDNKAAKALLAKTYDQLGYQAESAPWRDIYLTGAYELRHGGPEKGMDITLMEEVLKQTPVPRFLDSMSVQLNAGDAEGKDLSVKIIFTDLNESYTLSLKNSVLHHAVSRENETASDVTISLTHEIFIKMLLGKAGIKDTILSDNFKTEGSKLDLIRFLTLFEKPDGVFNIVTP
jgi:alkyl sulfatase BDS1-like metallo-beta-lactamase superfamily hydrolase